MPQTIDIIINILIFVLTVIAYASCFRREGKWDTVTGAGVLRYFTLQSNLFSAAAALMTAISAFSGRVPYAVWLLKYVSTAAVAVTLMTVMLYLGPAAGYKAMLSGRDMYLHLFGPLLAIVSFCFLERLYPLSFPLALTGVLPVAIYGALYLYKVVVCDEKKRWDDFYGFNKGGKWPLSFAAMLLGALIICLLLWLLYIL